MSHELDTSTPILYHAADGKAWHGLGQPIDAEGLIDAVAWIDANAPALSTDSYSIVPIKVDLPNGAQATHPTKGAVLRGIDGRLCGGTVGLESFSMPQPRELLRDAWRICGDIPGVRLSFCSYLSDGARWLATFNLGDFQINGEACRRHLVIHTGFDGSHSREFFLVATRVVCNNTLQVARFEAQDANQATAGAKVRNTKNADSRTADVTDSMRDIFAAFEKVKERGERLAKVKIDTAEAVRIVAKVLKGSGMNPEKSKRGESVLTRIIARFTQEEPQWQGTAWGLEQAVTAYATHDAPVRGARSFDMEGSKDRGGAGGALLRLDHDLFGTGAAFRAQAAEVIDGLLNGAEESADMSLDAAGLAHVAV